MSISKIFISNFVCVLTNERYKTYQTGFLFCRLGMPLGWDFGALGVPRGQGWAENSTPGIYRWNLPVFPGMANKAQVANTGK